MAPRGDYSDIIELLRTTLEPLVSKLESKVDRLEQKVDAISQDRVTRTDVEKLRKELVGMLVPRDAYEPRHAALVARDTQLESEIKALEGDIQVQMQRLHERLETGKQQIEDRFKEQANAKLSDQDRRWLRGSQIFGIIAVLISLLGLFIDLSQHVQLH